MCRLRAMAHGKVPWTCSLAGLSSPQFRRGAHTKALPRSVSGLFADKVTVTRLPPDDMIRWPSTRGRSVTRSRTPERQARSTPQLPLARSPAMLPLGQACGSAGSRSMACPRLCISISTMPAVPPKLPSI